MVACSNFCPPLLPNHSIYVKVLMMTLQNDPPSLESVSEYEDQYKNYGKSIRKLIVDCLQKDPKKRPTASELLKHPFIKKARDRRYLMQTLLPSTPSFAERSRRALDSKRFGLDSANNGESGSWVWPLEENNQKPSVTFNPEPKVAEVINENGNISSGGSADSTTDSAIPSCASIGTAIAPQRDDLGEKRNDQEHGDTRRSDSVANEEDQNSTTNPRIEPSEQSDDRKPE